MRCSYCIALAIFVAAVFAAPALSVAAPSDNLDIWYSLYFQSAHSGYSHITSKPDTWQGKAVERQDSETVTKLTVLGATVVQDIVSRSYSDPKTGQPFFETFKIESGGISMDVEASFTLSQISATLKSGGQTSNKVIQIPPGETIVDSDTEGMDVDGPLKVGQKEVSIEFDPVSLSLDRQTSTVLALNVPLKDPRDGIVHTTSKVFVQDPEGNVTAYQDAKGVPILVLMPAGLSMICTDDSHAMANDSSQASYALDPSAPPSPGGKSYDPTNDLATATAVTPTGLPLQDERTLTQLDVKVTVVGSAPKEFDETAVAVPPSDPAPIANLSANNLEYLKVAPYLSVDDPKIQALAKKIVGDETNSYQAVKDVHDWVFSHMTPVGTFGLPRSASAVLDNCQGVCRDYAVLYTSIARAAGIPTKINCGLVGFHGSFYYHAWASSYIGGTVGWLPVDATLPGMFVDASHIALGSGDATVMFNLSDVIGNTKVETLSTRNSL